MENASQKRTQKKVLRQPFGFQPQWADSSIPIKSLKKSKEVPALTSRLLQSGRVYAAFRRLLLSCDGIQPRYGTPTKKVRMRKLSFALTEKRVEQRRLSFYLVSALGMSMALAVPKLLAALLFYL